MKTTRARAFALVAMLVSFSISADAQTYVQGNPQATIRGGANANLDITEGTPTGTAGVPTAQLGVVTVKFAASPFDSARKHYVKIDLAGQSPNTNGPLYIQYSVSGANGQQSVQLWSLDQDYPGFNSAITWNTAQANDTASGSGLLTNGGFTATPYGRFTSGNSGTLGTLYTHTLHGGPWGQMIRPGNAVYLVFASLADLNGNGSRWRTNGAGAQEVYVGFEPITTGTPPTLGALTNNLAPNGRLTVLQGLYSTATNYFTVADSETAITSLTISPTSSSEANLPAANVFVEGTGATRSVYVLAPVGAAPGTYTVVLSLMDGDGNRATRSFEVALQQFNVPPAINMGTSTNSLPPTNTLVNTSLTVPFAVSDAESPVNTLTVSANVPANSASLLASATVNGAGPNTDLSVTVTPQSNVDGVGVVQLTCSDTNGNSVTANFCVMVRSNTSVVLVDHFEYSGANTRLNDEAPNFWTRRNATAQSVSFRSGTDPASGFKVAWIRPTTTGDDMAAPLVGGPYTTSSRAVLYIKFNATFADQAAGGPGNNVITNSSPANSFFRLSPGATSVTDYVNEIIACTNNAADPDNQFRLAIGNGGGTSMAIFPADFPKPANLSSETGPITIISRYDVQKAQANLWVNATSEADPNVAATDFQNPVSAGYVGLFQERGAGDIYIDDLSVILKIKPLITSGGPVAGGNVDLFFSAGTPDTADDFAVEGATAVTSAFGNVAATITSLGGGNFKATVPALSPTQGYYRVKRLPVVF